MKELLANSQPQREQLNITVESFCVGNTITLLENRKHCATGTNTSSRTIGKHVEFKKKKKEPTHFKIFIMFFLCGRDGNMSVI